MSHQGWFVCAGHYIFGCCLILFCLFCTCRHILAVVHFNANLHQDVKEHKKDKTERIKVMYPKFKNSEATIRNVTIKQNFSKLKSAVPFVNIYALFEKHSSLCYYVLNHPFVQVM